jgi:hypothetical protein
VLSDYQIFPYQIVSESTTCPPSRSTTRRLNLDRNPSNPRSERPLGTTTMHWVQSSSKVSRGSSLSYGSISLLLITSISAQPASWYRLAAGIPKAPRKTLEALGQVREPAKRIPRKVCQGTTTVHVSRLEEIIVSAETLGADSCGRCVVIGRQVRVVSRERDYERGKSVFVSLLFEIAHES